MEDSPGYTALGRYKLIRKIGMGAMGEVWLAEDPRLRRQVAIKILPLRRQDDQKFLAQFTREAQAAAALHHAYILPVHDYGQQEQPGGQVVTYLVMAYVPGGTLQDRLETCVRQRTLLPADEALAYLAQVAAAIDYAHAHGIVHCDIKPANMLLSGENRLLLADFGIAQLASDRAHGEAGGLGFGTPAYMAPEQARERAVPASDIYSLAVVAYQLFTGRLPFNADNPYALVFQHAYASPLPPRTCNPALPPAFEAILLQGLAKDPAQRPQSAQAFVAQLRQALPANYVSAVYAPTQPAGSPSAAERRTPRRAVLLGACGAALALAGGTALYLLSRRGQVVPGPRQVRGGTVSVPGTPTAEGNPPLTISAAFTKPVLQLAWSPRTNDLVAASDDGQLVLWTFQDNQTTPPQIHSRQDLFAFSESLLLSWSPDGSILALGNGGFDESTTIALTTLFYTSDLARTVPGIPVKFIDVELGIWGISWLSPTSLATIEEIDKDAEHFFLRVWNIKQPNQKPASFKLQGVLDVPIVDLTTQSMYNALTASPDGSTLAVSTDNGLLVGRLSATGGQMSWHQVGQVLTLGVNSISATAWSADGRYIAALTSINSLNNLLGIWDATRQYQALSPSQDLLRITGKMTHVVWSPVVHQALLAVGSSSGQVYIWNAQESSALVRKLSGTLASPLTSLAWSHDGKWLAASYADPAASVLIWRV